LIIACSCRVPKTDGLPPQTFEIDIETEGKDEVSSFTAFVDTF